MKPILLTFAFGFIGGALLAYSQTAQHYEKKAQELVKETEKAEQLRIDKSKGRVDELYEKWRDTIVMPEPVTVVERVFVRAKCPVQTDTSTGLDHGADDNRIELEERTVQSLERVAIKHEQLYKKCATQLVGAQALLSAE